jgi:predicted NBD/HSP70 family sugar kinase
MIKPEAIVGTVMGIGGSHAREAACYAGGGITHVMTSETPDNPTEFFEFAAAHINRADNNHAKWTVLGVPGTVGMADSQPHFGPLANVEGLSSDVYNVRRELIKADPDIADILHSGFTVIVVNDGDLAAHAVAARFAEKKDMRVAALINGTGVGTGVIERVEEGNKLFRTFGLPLEMGHLTVSDNALRTFESTISGFAIEQMYGMNARDIEAGHHIWKVVGTRMGRMAIMLGTMEGVDLVVPTGGLGVGASPKYRKHMETYIEDYRGVSNRTQQMLIPRIDFVPQDEGHEFELYGALGAANAYFSTHVVTAPVGNPDRIRV